MTIPIVLSKKPRGHGDLWATCELCNWQKGIDSLKQWMDARKVLAWTQVFRGR